MARGSQAKIAVTNKIANAFGGDYISESGGKIYVWADDGGERVQIAIALTCPKVMIDAPQSSAPIGGWDFSDDAAPAPAPVKAEVTEDEKQNIAELMARLGL